MSRADELFVSMCRDIIDNGTSTEGEKVRPHWPDGKEAYTIKRFGVVNRYDLRQEFPAITLRRTAIKSATDEMLWIWQRKSNNIHDLKPHIWDEWADEKGSIGKAYGYQMALKHPFRDVNEKDLEAAFGETYPAHAVRGEDDKEDVWYMDQVDRVIYDLKTNPFSRRILTTIYNPADLWEMRLQPCAYSMTFNVTVDKKTGKKVLNAILNQRSQDVLAANNWNVCQYAVLVYMLSQVTGMLPGELVHVIADAHIYDRHIPLVEELIQRKQYPAPHFHLNPDVDDFYAFTSDDVTLTDYNCGPQIKDIPIAI